MNTSTLVTDIVPLRDYFLTDALGSMRQLTDASGQVTLANAYEPYGVLAQSAGSAQTSYGFTGEFTDPSGMVYLRARYYMPSDGRFLTRDTWTKGVMI
ncbi:MAG TPA: RHS repeat-associated core domain-containing protein [Anaerolineales bacterium]|nr:RHS repeat-associated core domain-containing protein [Anaerolineales bacterium]